MEPNDLMVLYLQSRQGVDEAGSGHMAIDPGHLAAPVRLGHGAYLGL